MTPTICFALALTCAAVWVVFGIIIQQLESSWVGSWIEFICGVLTILGFLGALTFSLWGVWVWALSLS